MKKTALVPGDVIRVRAQRLDDVEHLGTFHHEAKSGLLVYVRQLRKGLSICAWKDVLVILSNEGNLNETTKTV